MDSAISFGELVRHFRKYNDYTQAETAKRLGYSEETIKSWEQGRRFPAREEVARLASLMELDEQEVRKAIRVGRDRTQIRKISGTPVSINGELVSLDKRIFIEREALEQYEKTKQMFAPDGDELARRTQDTESGETIDRREATKGISSFGLSLLIAPLGLEPFLENIASFDTAIETFTLYEKLLETSWYLSQGIDLETAERVLCAYLPKVVSLALLSSQQQRTAARIASQSYLLAASLTGHHNNLKARQSFSEQAMLFAGIAQDRNLQIAALRQSAVTFDYLARPDKVLQTYQQAFPYLHEISPLLRACVYAGVSGAYAQMRQQQEMQRFLGLAYECFPETIEGGTEYLYLTCTSNYSTLISWQALNYLELGQYHEAEKTFAQIDGLQPKIQVPERVRIELLNYQAETFIALENMEQARTYLEAAAKAARAIGSERRFQESFAVFQLMLKAWPHEQKVRVLNNLFT